EDISGKFQNECHRHLFDRYIHGYVLAILLRKLTAIYIYRSAGERKQSHPYIPYYKFITPRGGDLYGHDTCLVDIYTDISASGHRFGDESGTFWDHHGDEPLHWLVYSTSGILVICGGRSGQS